MPKAFDKCAKAGGKIRIKDMGNGKMLPICFMNGKSYPGHMKVKKSEAGNKYSGALAGKGTMKGMMNE